MDVARPFTALSPSVDVAVLVALAGSTTPRSGREIARRTGHSKTGVQHVLARLVDQGVVNCLQSGRTMLYSLNRDHLLAPIVEQIAHTKIELIQRLHEAIREWAIPATHASLFGSAARGDGDAESDIDLLVIRPGDVDPDRETWRGQIDELADTIRRWTGNNAGIVEFSQDELPRLRHEQPPVIEEIRRDAIDLAGEPARALLRGP